MHSMDVSVLLHLSRRKKRLSGIDGLEPVSDQASIRHPAASECNALMLSHVVHISPDSRKVHLRVADMYHTAAKSSLWGLRCPKTYMPTNVSDSRCLALQACLISEPYEAPQTPILFLKIQGGHHQG